MNDFKISVIVPTLNSHIALKELVSSFKIQTHKNWEVIFIDGESELDHLEYLKDICNKDKRFKWFTQPKNYPDIYGAMTYGMKVANQNNWIFFMGSDDEFINKNVLKNLNIELSKSKMLDKNFDILFCRCRYKKNKEKKRSSSFSLNSKERVFSNKEVDKCLFFGSTPPHQGTIMSPAARNFLPMFSNKYKLAADLDYILKIVKSNNIFYKSLNIELCQLGDKGISNKQTFRRIYEVSRIYLERYKFLFFVPLLLRYSRRIISKYFF